MDSAHFKGQVYVKRFYSANLCNGTKQNRPKTEGALGKTAVKSW